MGLKHCAPRKHFQKPCSVLNIIPGYTDTNAHSRLPLACRINSTPQAWKDFIKSGGVSPSGNHRGKCKHAQGGRTKVCLSAHTETWSHSCMWHITQPSHYECNLTLPPLRSAAPPDDGGFQPRKDAFHLKCRVAGGIGGERQRQTHANMRKADIVDGKSIADIMDEMPSHRVHTLEDVQTHITYVAAHWSRIRAFITKGKVVRFFIMRCV